MLLTMFPSLATVKTCPDSTRTSVPACSTFLLEKQVASLLPSDTGDVSVAAMLRDRDDANRVPAVAAVEPYVVSADAMVMDDIPYTAQGHRNQRKQ